MDAVEQHAVELTQAQLAALGAADRLELDPYPGTTLTLKWIGTRVAAESFTRRWDAVPHLEAVYDWPHDLWWPANPAGQLLTTLHGVDARALTRL